MQPFMISPRAKHCFVAVLSAAIGLAALCPCMVDAATFDPNSDVLSLPDWRPTFTSPAIYPPGTHLRQDRPHPAVVRVVAPEGNATSYGSGTLIDVRDQFGLVVTNWHVVRDVQGEVEVQFPDGF